MTETRRIKRHTHFEQIPVALVKQLRRRRTEGLPPGLPGASGFLPTQPRTAPAGGDHEHFQKTQRRHPKAKRSLRRQRTD
jgi:hypothetical protein